MRELTEQQGTPLQQYAWKPGAPESQWWGGMRDCSNNSLAGNHA